MSINVPSYIKNANSTFPHHWPGDDSDNDNDDVSKIKNFPFRLYIAISPLGSYVNKK